MGWNKRARVGTLGSAHAIVYNIDRKVPLQMPQDGWLICSWNSVMPESFPCLKGLGSIMKTAVCLQMGSPDQVILSFTSVDHHQAAN